MRKGIVTLSVLCELDEENIAPWEGLTEVQKEVFRNKTPQCEGAGDFGAFCANCDFCYDYTVIEAYGEV